MSHQPDNIPAGTQVVTLIEARGPNGSVVHPRGAVGIVTRTPAVLGENFLVRFPDGFEKSLARAQIEVLKHFKDRLGRPNAAQSSVRRNDSPSPVGASEGRGEGARASRSPPDESLNSSFELEPFIIYRCVGQCDMAKSTTRKSSS